MGKIITKDEALELLGKYNKDEFHKYDYSFLNIEKYENYNTQKIFG